MIVNFTKSDDSQRFKSGQIISGPGFSYKVKIVDTDPQEKNNSGTKSTGKFIF